MLHAARWSVSGRARVLVVRVGQAPIGPPLFRPLDDDERRGVALQFQGEMQSLLSYSCKQTGAQEYMVDCIAKFVTGYGNKSFKIMVQLGVTTLPAAYILKRWTWLVEEILVDMSSQVPGKVHEMPEESAILMKTTLMKNEFALLAKVGCRTDDGWKIIGTHLKEMKRELVALAKEQKKENQGLILLQLLQHYSECTIYVKLCCSTCLFCPSSWLQQPSSFFLWSSFDPNIMGQGATSTAASTHTMSKSAALGASSGQSASAAAARASAMSNSATPGVYTAEAAAGSNNQGHSSHAAASGLQIQGQIASMSVMGAYAWPMAAATDAISTPVDGSDKQHHSSHVVAPEPIIRDPEKSNTKGRKRKKSFQHPLNIGKREKRTCRLCGSNTHDARTCSTRDKPAPLQTEEEMFSRMHCVIFDSNYI
ncbi:hypothetical protein ZWY2020_008196 [Hordeum vulgare]|nr:hypothetical protein ZWY2020_008196 [Hordeum vulgare]